MARVNTVLADTFLPDGARIFLLKRGEHTGAFTSIVELTSGAFIEFDDNRAEGGLLRYATTSSIANNWANATHVAYGTTSPLEVFEFVEGEKDTIEPTGSSPFYSGRIVKIPNERYTIV